MAISSRTLLLILLLGSAAFVPGPLSLARSNTPAANTAPPTRTQTRSHWKQKYIRPTTTPFPADNLYSKDRDLLGKDLFLTLDCLSRVRSLAPVVTTLDSPGATALQEASVPA